jgi:hypothetical protein
VHQLSMPQKCSDYISLPFNLTVPIFGIDTGAVSLSAFQRVDLADRRFNALSRVA